MIIETDKNSLDVDAKFNRLIEDSSLSKDKRYKDFNGNVYYSLRKEGQDSFVSFTFDLYRWDRKNLRQAIDAEFKNHKRLFVKGSRYSADFWRCRNPITSLKDLEDDFKALSDVVEPILKGDKTNAAQLAGTGASQWPELSLPSECLQVEVAERINGKNIILPPVQRGKVWNAARCATLWDSILRGFSIGALSVQPAEGKYNLLDGQQRTTAILLGYEPFPSKNYPQKSEADKKILLQSVLWLDLCPSSKDECKFHFYVTTASQPWGYVRSTDENKNERIKFWEVRELLGNQQWHETAEKPYPCELWPKRAGFPVPFSLFREYVEKKYGDAECKSDALKLNVIDFLGQWREDEVRLPCWNWLRHANELLKGKGGSLEISDDIINAVRDLRGRSVLLQNSGKMTDDDVSLYFARIGKGGVVPSNEELAYSVMKVKLGKSGGDFRNGIEAIAEKHGLERQSRIAGMVVRYCLSIKSPGKIDFFAGDVLGKIREATHTTEPPHEKNAVSNKESWLDDLQQIVRINNGEKSSRLMTLCDKIKDELDREGYTSWHISRYCQRHNGVVYQFLMMMFSCKELTKWNDLNLSSGGIAELLCWYAPDPVFVIRKIIAFESFAEGFAAAFRDTHYNAQRMTIPVPSTYLQKVNSALEDLELKKNDVKDCEDKIKQSPDLLHLISIGYGDEASCSKLIFACNRHFMDSRSRSQGDNCCPIFRYNSNLDVWCEDARPWDYDHILPHSWVDNLKKAKREQYSWLVDSIGNLAPIDFSTNRSLSDNSRDEYYPLKAEAAQDIRIAKQKQDECFVDEDDAELIKKMGAFRDQDEASVAAFYRMTLSRFVRLYRCWSRSLTADGSDVRAVFNLKNNEKLLDRRQMILDISNRLVCSVIFEDAGGLRKVVKGSSEKWEVVDWDDFDWYVWRSIGLSCTAKDGDTSAVEIWIDRGCKCQIGLRDLKSQKYDKKEDVIWEDGAESVGIILARLREMASAKI